jgi:DNA-binding transcriptional ArsR family regulator
MSTPRTIQESLIKALGHPLRWSILDVVIDRSEASPIEVARILDQPLATVSHHMRVLRDAGCVELIRTEPRRGAVEHYYRAAAPAFIDEEHWPELPLALRRSYAGQTFGRIIDEAAAAGTAGAFDGATAHVDRMLVELDERGRDELSALLTDVLRQAQAIQARSDARRTDGADVRMSEIALLHFEPTAPDGNVAPPRRSPPLP